MPDVPPAELRRCLQFHLSTWFVLVALLAWAFAIWPWSDEVRSVIMFRPPGSTAPPVQVADESQDSDAFYQWVFSEEFTRGDAWPEFPGGFHPEFGALLLTLAAFLTWKYTWAIAQADLPRRKRLYRATVVLCPVTLFAFALLLFIDPGRPAASLVEILITTVGAFLFGLLVVLIAEIRRRVGQRECATESVS